MSIENDLANMAGGEQEQHQESSLMACPSCQGSVSVYANACPHCGHPFQEQPTPTHTVVRERSQKKVLTEQTGKSYKLGMIIGGLLMLPFGVLGALLISPSNKIIVNKIHDMGINADGMTLLWISIGGFLLGLFIFMAARISGWWEHG